MTKPNATEANKSPVNLFEGEVVRVLIVDDQEMDRTLSRLALGHVLQPRLEIFEASNAESALTILEAEGIDVCLVDYDLKSRSNGLDFYRAARHRGYRMPFIAVTGRVGEDTTEHQLLLAGFDDVLHKADLLTANLHRIIRNAWLRNVRARELLENALTDELTGLANQRRGIDRLGQEMVRAQREKSGISLMLVEFEAYAEIDARFGATVADHALCRVARKLTQSLRKVDTVARHDACSFVVIMGSVAAEDAASVEQRTVKAVADDGMMGVHLGIPLTVSARIAHYSAAALEPLTAEALFRHPLQISEAIGA